MSWDVIWDQTYNASYHQNLKSIQHDQALATMGSLRRTSTGKLFPELGFETLCDTGTRKLQWL